MALGNDVKRMAWIVALGALVPVMGLAADFSFKPFKRQHPYTDSGCCWAGFAAARGGDFNGDGLQDDAAIVDNDGIGNQLWVYRNRGAALPVLQARYTLPGLGAYARGIAVADFNEDGVDDVVVGTGQGISALVSNGNGRFAQRSFDEAQWRAFTRLRAMDFNHDGHYDVVGLGRNNDNAAMHLFLGDGRGHFAVARDLGIVLETRRVFADGWETTSLQDFHPVDVGNDGAVDLALGYEILRWWSNGAGPTYKGLFRIYRNNGAGLLPTPIDYPVDHNFRDFAVGDFNRDGRQDLATPLFAVWQQDSRGAFAQAYRLPIYPTPQTGLTAADLDGDGAEEAMTLHNGWWTYGFYLQRQRKLTGEWGAEWLLPGGNMFPDSLAVGDFFGSACNDAVVANDYEGLVFLEGQDCHARTVHEDVVPNALDANGNGKSDLLLREPAAHRFVTWYMSGTSRAGSSMHAIGDAYRLAATGDFNGDGRSDLLWTSAARDLVISFSTGLNYSEAGVALAYAANWRVIGAADINGNGKDDILLRNAVTGQLVVWYMDGSRRLSNSAHAVPVAYRFAGSGDFDHDGRQDLAWTSAQRDVLISRSTATGFVDRNMGLTYNSDYALAGTSDIDGDGATDLLLSSRRLGKLQVWFMDGTTRRAYASKTIGGSYRLIGKGDYNGDHRGDLAWVNDANQILFALGSDTGVVTVLSRDRTRAVVMDVR
jgi:hypothetical protein